MKFPESISRRIAVLMSALCILAAAQLALTTAQTFLDSDYISSDRVAVIGTVGVWLGPDRTDLPLEPLTLRASADGTPEIAALPREVTVYSTTGSLPDGCRNLLLMRKAMLGIRLGLTVLLIAILFRLMAGFMHGIRTGEVFRPKAPRMMRWAALLAFFYCAIGDNFHIFDHLAVKNIIADTPLADIFFGSVRVDFGTFFIPLCMLVLAEVLAVGYRLNEEESFTL